MLVLKKGLNLLLAAALVVVSSGVQADSFSVRSIDNSDTGVGDRRFELEASFVNEQVISFMEQGLSMPFTVRITNTVTSEQYLFQEVDVEFPRNRRSLTSIDGEGTQAVISYRSNRNAVSILINKDTQGIVLGAGEELRVDILLNWSLLCACYGSYSGTFVIGEHVLQSAS